MLLIDFFSWYIFSCIVNIRNGYPGTRVIGNGYPGSKITTWFQPYYVLITSLQVKHGYSIRIRHLRMHRIYVRCVLISILYEQDLS